MRRLIQQRLHSGGFESVEDVLFYALEMQREREAWIHENKEAINTKIERGLAQLDRGEGISEKNCVRVWQPTRRRGSRTALIREALPRRAGGRRRSPPDLALPAWRGGLAIAARIQGELVGAFEGLANAPVKGHKRPDLTGRDVLFFSVYQYIIVYRRTTLVEIVASCPANAR